MNRVLIATMPAAGHVGPLLPLARELVRRGHVVAWYTGSEYREKVEATGAVFYPHVHAPQRDMTQMDAATGRARRVHTAVWWDEMQLDRRPVVLVTQGTVATDPQELLIPALAGLRDENVQVIAVTGGPDPADLPAPPANARSSATCRSPR